MTTVLLVKNENENHGRFVNVRPEVGLLTSTARTFIQEGVTTEYATQVVGTTLDNGRVYAQYLKKSSRVLYDGGVAPSVVTSWVGDSTLLPQSHNDLFDADQPDWQAIDDRLLGHHHDFVGNTDYVGIRESTALHIVSSVASKSDDFSKTLTWSSSSSTSTTNDKPLHFAGRFGVFEEDARKVAANKVLPIGDLPTYTIKQHYEPSGYFEPQVENKNGDDDFGRNPKLIYKQLMLSNAKSENEAYLGQQKTATTATRHLATVTYYGFADFTTVVGDSVIVFSPSTASANANANAHVTSIKGEATLGAGKPQGPSVSTVPITLTQDLIEPTLTQQIDMISSILVKATSLAESEIVTESPEDTSTEPPNNDDVESLKEGNPIVDVSHLETSEVLVSEITSSEQSRTQTSSVNSLEASVMLSRPSDEEILRIYNALANADANKKKIELTTSTTTTVSTTIDPTVETSNVQISGGATTIFFEDDPFSNFVEPAKTSISLATTSIELTTSNTQEKNTTTTSSTITEEVPYTTSSTELTTEPELTFTTEIPIEVHKDVSSKDIEDINTSITTTPSNTTETLSGNIVIKEIDPNDKNLDVDCIRTSQVFLTQLPKTITQLATVVVTNALNSELKTEIRQELQPTFDIGQATKYYCIQASKTETMQQEQLETISSQTHQQMDSGNENKETQIGRTTIEIDKQTHDHEVNVEETEEKAENPLFETTENSIETITEQIDLLADGKVEEAEEELIKDGAEEGNKDDGNETEMEEKEVMEEEEEEEISDNSDDEDEEEIELIYKTLYTTYTYLTTFFHDESTSISSHTEVVTNVQTSTLGITPTTALHNLATHQLTANLNENEINPTMIVSSHKDSTKRYMVPTEVETFIRSEEEIKQDKEYQLTLKSDSQAAPESLATFYTTYTYYTTIFAEGETEIMSHTEVITNLQKSTPTTATEIVPTASVSVVEDLMVSSSNSEIASENKSVPNNLKSVLIEPSQASDYSTISLATSLVEDKSSGQGPSIPELGDLSAITLVTDVRSSSSTGNQQVIKTFNPKKLNELKSFNDPIQQSTLEDQISSESNTDTDEIIPSATLLLQTSFTTFTYYTTMYSGDKTNVISRLETMTNTVTETLQASKTINPEEASIPITYFTTFTYWTKLAKEGQITTLSREETISNIITPTGVMPHNQDKMTTSNEIKTELESPVINNDVTVPVSIKQVEETALVEAVENVELSNKPIITTHSTENVFVTSVLEPTTYYTTYTYYTTSYETDNTITDSRFETVTNIVTPTITVTNTIKVPEGIASALPSSPSLTSRYGNATSEEFEKSNLILYDLKKIIDADGISTIYFTTHIKSSVNAEGLPTEIISSTSSLYIDEEKKTLLTLSTSAPTIGPDGQTQKQYKTGLVRLIEGTRIGNHTTTLYQSKVIGTVIDQRYAQIIESTSSFIVEKTQAPQDGISVNSIISPTSATEIENVQVTQQATLLAQSNLPNIEGSIGDQPDQNQESSTEPDDGGTNEEEGTTKTDEKLRFPFQTKKRPFIPPLKSFPNRSRPQFAPKKNSSATIITRSDFTPTITATPALKTVSRFSSTRRGGSVPNSGNPPVFASSSRRSFGRPNKSSSNSGSQGSSSIGALPGLSSSTRNRFGSGSSSIVRPSFASSSKRSGGAATLRPSFSRPALFSTGYPGNSKLRVKPTATLDVGESSTSSLENSTNSPSNSQEEDDDSISQDEQNEEENTTESNRRQNNPLLRLRRPPNRPQGFTPARPATQLNSPNNAAAVTQRRNPLTGRARSSGSATTTTTTTTTQKPRPRTFQRPAIGTSNTQNRARPTNSLFPPRNIFGAQKTAVTTEDTNTKDLAQSEEDTNDDDSEYDDEDDEEAEGEEDDENNRRRRSNGKHLITSKNLNTELKAKSRIKREAESTSQQNRANFRNRFRRPKLLSSPHPAETKGYDEEEVGNESSEASPVTHQTTPSHRTRSRFGARHPATTTAAATTAGVTTKNHRAIRPTRPSSSNGARAQFTLREKDSSTTTTTQKGLTVAKRPSFRRPQPAGGPSTKRFSSSTASSSNTTAGKRRLKSYTSSNDASSHSRNVVSSRNRSPTTSSRSRSGSSRDSGVRGRARGSHDYNNDLLVADNGGTLTVTHVIPAEVTIPVINGKVTEYKQVVTAKTSTEVVGPQHYTTTIGSNGQSRLVLTREDTSVNYNGGTEVTQFVLHETPTTTITFTPTTIRGRKTSFSHVLPSTIYSVEQVVSTQQPQISANAPLANILLSQLLLGNVGLPTNPLLGAIGGALNQPGPTAAGPPQPATPVTEYKTHASTYVTTLFEGQSTILPITFQGKKILTTIFDTTAQTITATEFITDTIVTTPTAQAQQAQPAVNSLLLQQLLLQQHLQQQQLQQQTDPTNPLNAILNSVPPQFLLGGDSLQELDVTNNIRGSGHGDLINDDDAISSGSGHDLDDISALQQQAQTHKSGRKKSRKNGKNHKRKSHNVESAAAESSVITLYVSGRRPGEFSTVLSTVQVRPDSTLYKRQANTIDSYADYYNSEGSENINEYLAVPEIILLDQNLNITDSGNENMYVNEAATQSLESIVGDVTRWYKTQTTTQQALIMRTTPTRQTEVTSSNEVVLKSEINDINSKEMESSNNDSILHDNQDQPQDTRSDDGNLNYLGKNHFFA